MTEEEWLTSEDPEAVATVVLVSPRVSDRTCRLFASAVWDQLAARSPGRAKTLEKRIAALEKWAETGAKTKWVRDAQSTGAVLFAEDARAALLSACELSRPMSGRVKRILSDIFGNPFRPVTVDPAWLSSTAVSLAQDIYADRAFDRLPILADALQDAGCEDADILSHCRGDGPHVRGCWVVDLVLGKQ